MTLAQAVQAAQHALAHLANPAAEALSLVLQSQNFDRVEWMLRPDQALPDPARFHSWLERRINGESLAVIRGYADFMDYRLAVGPGVLVPRPDTETFSQVTLAPGPTLDLGCGSGAIARWVQDQDLGIVIALDYALMALSYARRNLPLSVGVVRGDWARCIADSCIANVLANPPYIDRDEPELAGDGVRCEPLSALVAADQGLSDIKMIAQQACRILQPGGWLWIEHGYQQAPAVQGYLTQLGFAEVQSLTDLLQHPRITGGQWNG